MVKAGKKIRKQIRRNKKTPSKQVVKKRMNVREIMLEKMRMGMLVPQQQATPQQVQQNNEMDKLRSQINVAEKGLSDERLKRKALEAERERLKVEKEEEIRLRKQQDDEIQKLKKEYKKKSKEYENERRFNEKIEDLKEKREDLDQKIQDEEAIGELEARYKHEKKTFDREQEMKKKGEEYFEKYDELQYKQEQAMAKSKVTQMEQSLAAEKAQYEAIKHAEALAKAEIAKNKVYEAYELQKKKNEAAQVEVDALHRVIKSKMFTNSLAALKTEKRKELSLKNQKELAELQYKNAEEAMRLQAELEAQNEYYYGTEEQQKVPGFVSDGDKHKMKLEKAIIDHATAMARIKEKGQGSISKAEAIEVLNKKKNEAVKSMEAARIDVMIAENTYKDNETKFDKNGHIIISDDDKKIFEEEARAHGELDIQKQRLEIQKSKTNLERERSRTEYIKENMENEAYIKQIKDIQREVEQVNQKADIQKRKNILMEQEKKMRMRKALEEARNSSSIAGSNRHGESAALYDQRIAENKVFMQQRAMEDDEYELLVQEIYPFMCGLEKEGAMDDLKFYLSEHNQKWEEADLNNWLLFSNDELKELKYVARNNGGVILSPQKSSVVPSYDETATTPKKSDTPPNTP